MEPYKEAASQTQSNEVSPCSVGYEPTEEEWQEFRQQLRDSMEPLHHAQIQYNYFTGDMAWKCYGLTLKKCFLKQSLPDIAYYQDVIHCMQEDGVDISDVNYELDSTGLLHCHAIMYIHPKVYRKNLKPKGCHMHLNLIESNKSLEYWYRYIIKDKDEPDKEQLQALYKSGSLF